MSKDAAPRVGEAAPDFTLKDGEGRDWRLSERRGRVVVLLFYPGDELPAVLTINRTLQLPFRKRAAP